VSLANAAFNNKVDLFNRKLTLNVRKKLVKSYITRIALYGAETWTLRRVRQVYLGGFEIRSWRRMQKISWTDRMRKEEVLYRMKEEKNT
jgi:hypothetical protein